MKTRNHICPTVILSASVCLLLAVVSVGCDRDRGESREAIKSSLPAGADLNQPRSLTLMGTSSTSPEPPACRKQYASSKRAHP